MIKQYLQPLLYPSPFKVTMAGGRPTIGGDDEELKKMKKRMAELKEQADAEDGDEEGGGRRSKTRKMMGDIEKQILKIENPTEYKKKYGMADSALDAWRSGMGAELSGSSSPSTPEPPPKKTPQELAYEKAKQLEMQKKQKEKSASSYDDEIRDLFPDLDDAQIAAKVKSPTSQSATERQQINLLKKKYGIK